MEVRKWKAKKTIQASSGGRGRSWKLRGAERTAINRKF